MMVCSACRQWKEGPLSAATVGVRDDVEEG